MNFLITGVLIDRYWRVFLNYQKTESVLTAKASRYTEVTWTVLRTYQRERERDGILECVTGFE
jgi:hypothetical protein